MILVKSHAKISQKVCQPAEFGPSGPNIVRFGSTLDMLFLSSNMHQNLWNSLVIMVMAWLWPIFHEIRQSVGGENHRYRPPTANSWNGQATNFEPLFIVRSWTKNYKTYTKSTVLHLLVTLESRKVLNLDDLSPCRCMLILRGLLSYAT